jgi:hypothetical protein
VFLNEAQLPADTGQLSRDALTIETVLSEKKTYDLNLRFEKLGQTEANEKWKLPCESSVALGAA